MESPWNNMVSSLGEFLILFILAELLARGPAKTPVTLNPPAFINFLRFKDFIENCFDEKIIFNMHKISEYGNQICYDEL
jgi:hypothetical protein